ncbi:M20/M25/M40 family metallo-hydrolase [Sutterella faecalis]|uniref:M20/M25/M40 family metallo-hydrolase n=2 Tax=Sutterella TaxID=40544 RepID=A0AAI9SCS7_9BURK|nr:MULTISPECIES: M20/M25/M40 family metallo-hydrolase [Sutterella]KAB7652001.1 M20/M25/M40 family metallo-hydrolase [Sutterella seckii]MBE5692799.1 M20/M25/M40 family metallo-hydrolase [Sutterella sp.]QDA54675.1 M20/M25/M40 family metallo-hydrolase [Sutterella faecalis]
MTQNIPPLSEEVFAQVKKLAAMPAVKAAMEQAAREVDRAMEEQIELCEIEAPTFHEETRAKRVAELMRAYDLTDVVTDPIGNVVGRRPGKGNGPVLALGAHMDTVFPAGTDVKVRREGNIYRAPGIGDNCSGLRALLQILRMFNDQKIETEGDILFVGTVGEEGNGDIRGSKALFDGTRHIDGFVAIDSTDVGRILHGATGSHRWRLSVDGKGGHSYAEFGRCPSAIHAICRAGAKVGCFRVPADPKTTYTIGTIKGGTTVNTIAAHCEVEVDMRSVSNEELLKLEERVLKAFEEAVQEENDFWGITDESLKLKLTKTQIGNRPAGMRPDDCPVLQTARSAQKVLGIELTKYMCASTDANAPMSLGIPATCLCSGGRGMNAHSVTEYFEMVDTQLGPQLVFLTAAALVGACGEKPVLPVRK